jgi:hypothetical protein
MNPVLKGAADQLLERTRSKRRTRLLRELRPGDARRLAGTEELEDALELRRPTPEVVQGQRRHCLPPLLAALVER